MHQANLQHSWESFNKQIDAIQRSWKCVLLQKCDKWWNQHVEKGFVATFYPHPVA